jgi:hypothetical protein
MMIGAACTESGTTYQNMRTAEGYYRVNVSGSVQFIACLSVLSCPGQ